MRTRRQVRLVLVGQESIPDPLSHGGTPLRSWCSSRGRRTYPNGPLPSTNDPSPVYVPCSIPALATPHEAAARTLGCSDQPITHLLAGSTCVRGRMDTITRV